MSQLMSAMQLIVGTVFWRCLLIPQQPMFSDLEVACVSDSFFTEQGLSTTIVALHGAGTTLTYVLPAEQSTTTADTRIIGQLCGLL